MELPHELRVSFTSDAQTLASFAKRLAMRILICFQFLAHNTCIHQYHQICLDLNQIVHPLRQYHTYSKEKFFMRKLEKAEKT